MHLSSAHHRQGTGVCEHHESAVHAKRIRLSGQVSDEILGRAGDMHLGRFFGTLCKDAGRIERHAQVSRIGIEDRRASSRRPGASVSAASRITSMSTRAR